MNSGGEGCGAFGATDGGDGKMGEGEERSGDGATDVAAGLGGTVRYGA